ncbi:MAG TPA: SDR family oxidoreductase [Leptospiraceae bacterium]|nr:SDR family oxidoreductase [Leptospiraceae bacterium]HMX31089.1 SDR family oxidoreductase [Leptospiraceae bacterium]HMY31905.1 SDR family oxidoreductase [Leptospiraceae bacterium]HMZ65263.1 SDR family oxidoreductase [Leptospiraceae bacterium]HNA06280.1 SDR family oxidoreductase [Leptospiraceae bacterium]
MANYLIIGSSSGIGKEISSLLNEKKDVTVIGAGRENRQGESNFHVLDVTKPETFPELDCDLHGLVYCPGTITLKSFRTLKEDDFMKDFEINLLGAFRILQKYLPLLQRTNQASVVLFSTVAVGLGLPYHASISAAKGAIEGLTRTLAAEWSPKIRVNAIAPSLTDTKLSEKLLDTDTKRKSAEERHPLKKIGQARDIASLACWLLTDSSQFVTGQVWKMDGGLGSVKITP